MSRSKKGKKDPGSEFWGKRPMSMSSPSKENKKLTHSKERAQAKQKLARIKKGKDD